MLRKSGSARIVAIAVVASLAVPFLIPWKADAAAGDIDTVAGGTGAGPATGVGQTPFGISVRGNVTVIADFGNHVVRRLDLDTREERTIAGTGEAGFSGDGGPATEARLTYPTSAAADDAGNVYIADTENHRVRRVSPTGTITTLAGQGAPGFAGDNGPAERALLWRPRSLAVSADSKVLFIADANNHRVRKVVLATGVISTVAGGPLSTAGTAELLTGERIGGLGDGGPAVEASLSLPSGVAVTGDGTLYIADTANSVVRKVAVDGIITTVAGRPREPGYSGDGGDAASAQLSSPTAVSLDSMGRILIVQTGNHVIRRVDTNGLITTIAGTGSEGYEGDGGQAAGAKFKYPYGVASRSDGSFVIADTYNYRLRLVAASGIITTIAGTDGPQFGGDGRAATEAQLLQPRDVALAPDGTTFVADTGNNRVRRISAGGTITTVAGTGALCPQREPPADPEGEPGYPGRNPCGDGGSPTNAQITAPWPSPSGLMEHCTWPARAGSGGSLVGASPNSQGMVRPRSTGTACPPRMGACSSRPISPSTAWATCSSPTR